MVEGTKPMKSTNSLTKNVLWAVRRQHGPVKCWHPTTSLLHSVITHKTTTGILIAVKTSHLTASKEKFQAKLKRI